MAERLAATTNSFAAIADELVEKIRKEGKSEVTIRKLGWFLDMAKPEPRPFSRTRGYFTPVHERGIEWVYGFFNSQPAKGRLRADRHSRDQALFLQIIRSFKASKKRYGSKRVHWDIIASGEIVSERRVARIMRENKNSPRLIKRRKPITTDSNHKMAPSPNLLDQEFNCQMPNTIWLADITYVGTDQGWLYVAAIKDMATREIVGSLSGSCKRHVQESLEKRGITQSPSRQHTAHAPAGQ